MAKYDCEICQGRGLIQIPIYRRVSFASGEGSIPAQIGPSSKTYPCPECALTAPTERIAIVDFHSRIARQEFVTDPHFIDHAHRCIAMEMAGLLLHDKFFRFRTAKADPTANYAATITGTLGVVAPTHVATIEQRQREHQEKIADEVTTEAIAQISNWGSYFGHSEILKRDARRLIDEALKTVLAKHPKEPT